MSSSQSGERRWTSHCLSTAEPSFPTGLVECGDSSSCMVPVTSRKDSRSKASVTFRGVTYDACATTAPHGRRSPAFRMWYDKGLSYELKGAFAMSYMRSLEESLQRGGRSRATSFLLGVSRHRVRSSEPCIPVCCVLLRVKRGFYLTQVPVANQSTSNKMLPITNAIRALPRPSKEHIMLRQTRRYPQCTHGLTYIENQWCQGCRISHLICEISNKKTGSETTK